MSSEVPRNFQSSQFVCRGYSGTEGNPDLKFIIEILRLNSAQTPRILYGFSHTASSVHMVRETMKAITESSEWPPDANGFRILSETGVELYRWPE
jgi:hypothetical protein